MVDRESDAEFRSVAQATMMAAQAHHQAAELCLNSLNGRPVDHYLFYFSTVSAELLEQSIEQSLKLTLVLNEVPLAKRNSKSGHDIFELYKKVICYCKGEKDIQSEIVRITNIYAFEYGFRQVREVGIPKCIERHKLSYVEIRYFGVDKSFSSVPDMELDWDDLRLLSCLCPGLIEINIDLMKKYGIPSRLSLRQDSNTKLFEFTFQTEE